MKTEKYHFKSTKKQRETVRKFADGNFFRCPSCKVESLGIPVITNEGEDNTQIWCTSGCGFIFLENYINQNKDDE